MKTKNEHLETRSAALRVQLMALVRRMRREADLPTVPFSHLSLLGAIDRLCNDVNPATLAEAEGLRSSNLSALLRKLEEEGYVKKRQDGSDKRMSRISLTDEGRRVLERNRVHRESWLAGNISTYLTESEQATLFQAGELIERLATIGIETGKQDNEK